MNLPLDTELIENYTFDEISIGQSAQLLRTLTLSDIEAFAAVSGDTNQRTLIRNTPMTPCFTASLHTGCGAVP